MASLGEGRDIAIGESFGFRFWGWGLCGDPTTHQIEEGRFVHCCSFWQFAASFCRQLAIKGSGGLFLGYFHFALSQQFVNHGFVGLEIRSTEVKGMVNATSRPVRTTNVRRRGDSKLSEMEGALPKGARELLIALQTPSPKGHMGIPCLLWGAPGEGKSSFVESLSREDFPVVTLIASIHDPTDFSGLPVHQNGKVQFAPPEWVFAFEPSGQGILFLDELTTAPPSVQAALLRVVLERKVGFRDLPKGVRVVAAANPPDIVTGGWELSPPLRNRFVHIQWELSGEDYLQALREGFACPELPPIDPEAHRESQSFWKMIVEAFLKRNPNLVRTSPSSDGNAFASPRTWDYAIALMASCDLLGKAPKPGKEGSEEFLNLLEGCVGRGVAIAFVQFLRELRLPDPEEVLSGNSEVDVRTMRDDELFVLFSALAATLAKWVQRDNFLDAMLRFLSLAEQICGINKTDTIYVHMRQVARGRLLHQAITKAVSEGRLEEVQKAMERTFEATPLKDFVNMLTSKEVRGTDGI